MKLKLNPRLLHIIFFIAFIQSIYSIYLLRQLFAIDTWYSSSFLINVIATISIAVLGIGAFLAKWLKSKYRLFLFLLMLSLCAAQIIIMFNLDLLVKRSMLPVLAIPMLIIGVIIARVYLDAIEDKKAIAQLVFFHTIGYLSGFIASIIFIKFAGVNFLFFSSLVMLLILSFRTSASAIVLLSITAIMIVPYNILSLEQRTEEIRHVQYHVMPFSSNKSSHLYSGWSPYSKIDIFEISGDCVAGLYNYKQQWYTCSNASMDFDARHFLYFRLQGNVAVLGSGGGMGCLTLFSYKRTNITCIELDPVIVDLFRHEFSKFNGNVYNLVNARAEDGRHFLDSAEGFDYIIYEGTDFSVAKNFDSFIEPENYMFSYEGITEAFSAMNPNGTLLIVGISNDLVFEKIQEIVQKNNLHYLYYNFNTHTPLNYFGKMLILSKDEQQIKFFKKEIRQNGIFVPADFKKEAYELVTDDKPFLYRVNRAVVFYIFIILFAVSILIIIAKPNKTFGLYFLFLGISLVMVECFVFAKYRSILNDYATTYSIINIFILTSFSFGSLFYQRIRKLAFLFPAIAIVSFIMISNLNFSSLLLALSYTMIAIIPLFTLLGSYFPYALSNIHKDELPAMYLLDSIGSAAGLFLFYLIAFSVGIKYTFIIASAFYLVISLFILLKK